MTVESRPGATVQRAVQRGLDTLTARPGKNVFGSAWNEDREIIDTIADLLHLQEWRQNAGLSLLRPEEALSTAKDTWIVESCFSPVLVQDEGAAS